MLDLLKFLVEIWKWKCAMRDLPAQLAHRDLIFLSFIWSKEVEMRRQIHWDGLDSGMFICLSVSVSEIMSLYHAPLALHRVDLALYCHYLSYPFFSISAFISFYPVQVFVVILIWCWYRGTIFLFLKRRLSSGKRWKIICEHYSFLLCKCGRTSVKTCSLKSMTLQMPSYSKYACKIVKIGGPAFYATCSCSPIYIFLCKCL